jgi:hypothetical protein
MSAWHKELMANFKTANAYLVYDIYAYYACDKDNEIPKDKEEEFKAICKSFGVDYTIVEKNKES